MADDQQDSVIAETDKPAVTRKLVLGRIGPGDDPERTLVLGARAFSGHDDLLVQWTERPDADLYQSREDARTAGHQLKQLVDCQLVRLAEHLNARHGQDYGLAFWRTLLLPWMVILVQQSWGRYREAERLISQYGGTPLEYETAPDIENWDFATTDEFVANSRENPAFDFWLNTRIVDSLAPPLWNRRPASEPIEASGDPVDYTGAYFKSRGIRKIVNHLMGRQHFADVPGVGAYKIFFHIFLRLQRASAGMVKAPPEPPTPSAPPAEIPAAYITLLDDLCQSTLPRAFGREFSELEASTRQHAFRSGQLNIRTLSWYNDRDRLAMARAEAAGERLLQVQHGGFYGVLNSFTDVAQIEYGHSAFITWGWRQHQDYAGNFVPLPSPLLSRYRNKHRFREPRLILVGTQAILDYFRFDALPQPSQWVENRRQKCAFIDGLGNATRPALQYRPYLKDVTDLEDEPYFRRRYPDLDILTTDLNPALLCCRLLVLDHPGTTLNLAMAANVPTICFWDAEMWPLSDQAKPVFEQMRNAGIFLNSGAAAAGQVDAVWDRVTDWWSDTERQSARQKFCENYALTSRAWWWDWFKAIKELS